jgi:YHS domain-containing protein
MLIVRQTHADSPSCALAAWHGPWVVPHSIPTEQAGMLGNLLYFLLFAALFAFMMRFGCGAHVMGPRGKHDPSDDARDSAPRIANHSVEQKDPVCGMSVNTTQAKSALYADRPYYFCSPACREKFEARPNTFIQPAITGATA